MEKTKTAGTGFLKVTGILMIVFGAIAIVVTGIGIAAVGVIEKMANSLASMEGITVDEALAEQGVSLGLLYMGMILSLVGAIVQLVAGIIGIKNCRRPEKAQTCLVWGVLVALFAVAGSILTPIAGGDFNILSLFTGLVIPVLFIIGALKNKQA